jgi:hypothetical protein
MGIVGQAGKQEHVFYNAYLLLRSQVGEVDPRVGS